MSTLKAVGLIPARLESTRLPNKALRDICGLPMIVHVFKRCQLAKRLSDVIVCTDNSEIKAAVERHGGKVAMTSPSHRTGTDRIAEVARGLDFDLIVNVQGDEALVNPEYIDRTITEFESSAEIEFTMLVNPYDKRNSDSDIKVVLNKKNDVLYLSRADVPSFARTKHNQMLKAYHIIGFRKAALLTFANWQETPLEAIEYNEYLRILENCRNIRAIHVESDAISVDKPEDLAFVTEKMATDRLFQKYKI